MMIDIDYHGERLLSFRVILDGYRGLSRMPWSEVVETLNGTPVPSASGKQWTPKTAKNFFDNHRSEILSERVRGAEKLEKTSQRQAGE